MFSKCRHNKPSPDRYVPLFMNFKLLISTLTILSSFAAGGQNLKIDTYKPISVDTNSLVRCQVGPSIASGNNKPLLIINGKDFGNCSLQNIFFELDTTTISSIEVLNPQNKSVLLYGTNGRNGVIDITTKETIGWTTLKQILKQKANKIYSSKDKTLIKVDNSFFFAEEELYFQKNLIKTISILNNTTQYYGDRQFNSVITISLSKKSGT